MRDGADDFKQNWRLFGLSWWAGFQIKTLPKIILVVKSVRAYIANDLQLDAKVARLLLFS